MGFEIKTGKDKCMEWIEVKTKLNALFKFRVMFYGLTNYIFFLALGDENFLDQSFSWNH